MYQLAMIEETTSASLRAHHSSLRLRTTECLEFIDLTQRIKMIIAQSGVRYGTVNVQTKHTTTAIIVNENEPLLIDDLRSLLDQLAPSCGQYQHNDFSRRLDIPPDEPANGHSHCKALFLAPSVCLNVVDGRLDIGQWQSIFLVELDEARERTVSVMVMGQTA